VRRLVREGWTQRAEPGETNRNTWATCRSTFFTGDVGEAEA